MTDPILSKFRQITWHYGDKDPGALGALEERVADAGRKRKLLTYSELVAGVRFNLPNVRDGERVIDIGDWSDLDRAIVGSFLGFMSLRSYEAAGFFASALVVSKLDGSPSEGFYSLLKDLGLVASSRTDKAMYIWADHVAKAHTWYSRHPAGVRGEARTGHAHHTPPVDVIEPALLIRINQLYWPEMPAEDLYDATRGVWVIGERRHAAVYALAIADGIVREVYEIESWHPAGTTPYATRVIDQARYGNRWEFVGRLAPDAIRAKYVGHSVAHYFARGASNPVMYANF
jgi:hypothetical protein